MSMQSSNIFFCVGVMYSGEYDVCGVPLILFVCVGLNTFHRKIIGNIEINCLLMINESYLVSLPDANRRTIHHIRMYNQCIIHINKE